MPHDSLGHLVRADSRGGNHRPGAGRAINLSVASPIEGRTQLIMSLRQDQLRRTIPQRTRSRT